MSQPAAHTAHGGVGSYVVGFVLSLALTLVAYTCVVSHSFGTYLIAVIVALAIAQLLVQLFFFLHLGRESKPRWKLVVFLFMLLVLAILVFGSLWIMNNLNYHMSPSKMDDYILHDEGVKY
jgi:cytochrome o ubiquinol oxidase operon protein cyoD